MVADIENAPAPFNKRTLSALIVNGSYAILFIVLWSLHIYWISDALQYAAHLVYFAAVLLFLWLLYYRTSFRLHPLFLIPIYLLLIAGSLWHTYLVLPWILLVPLFGFRGKGTFWFAIASIVYGLFIILFGLLLILRLLLTGFIVDTPVAAKLSPDGHYRATVFVNDQGALGGDTVGKLETRFGLWKQTRTVYYGHYRETSTIEWIDNNSFTIDGFAVRTDSPEPVYEQ